jgi:hypothetical protein
MFRWARPATLALASMLLAACAPTPRPWVLKEIEQVRSGAAASEAKRQAPDAFAHAEKLRREASAAFEAEDLAASQALGERALAAYAHALALARIAHAEEAEAQARKALAAAQAELSAMEADQTRVAAELDALDMKIKVARDAQPVVPSGRADPEREEARRAAARALSLQARMLCAAARLLSTPAAGKPGEAAAAAPAGKPGEAAAAAPAGKPGEAAPAAPAGKPGEAAAAAPASLAEQLAGASAAVDKLEADLAQTGPAPIDQASRVRASCLAVLTAARRAATPVSRAPGVGDALHTWGGGGDLKYCSSCDVPTQNREGINEKKKSTKDNDDKLFSHTAIAMIAENAQN